jgi:hypothetical protein
LRAAEEQTVGIDRDEFFEAVWPLVSEEANHVLTLAWEGGGMPGTSGVTSVSVWRGLHFVTSSDYDDEGPYASLEETLARHPSFETPTTEAELTSETIPLELLLEIAKALVPEDGDTIRVNGTTYIRKGGGFVSEDVDE